MPNKFIYKILRANIKSNKNSTKTAKFKLYIQIFLVLFYFGLGHAIYSKKSVGCSSLRGFALLMVINRNSTFNND